MDDCTDNAPVLEDGVSRTGVVSVRGSINDSLCYLIHLNSIEEFAFLI